MDYMPKFFIDSSCISQNSVTLFSDDFFHLCKSLRKTEGDFIILCDKKGFDYHAKIVHIENDSASLEIIEKYPSYTELPFEIHIFQAIPKGSKMEWIIQKNTELGVFSIIPFDSERCVSKLSGKEEKKVTRWQKICDEAAKQSGRSTLPKIADPMSFDEAVCALKQHDIFFVAYEGSMHHRLKEVLLSQSPVKSIAFMVGSEGGFSPQEAAIFDEMEIPTITLGNRILRTETAAMAISSMIIYELGDVN
jgi:RNA methyltransferase, RsmE family